MISKFSWKIPIGNVKEYLKKFEEKLKLDTDIFLKA